MRRRMSRHRPARWCTTRTAARPASTRDCASPPAAGSPSRRTRSSCFPARGCAATSRSCLARGPAPSSRKASPGTIPRGWGGPSPARAVPRRRQSLRARRGGGFRWGRGAAPLRDDRLPCRRRRAAQRRRSSRTLPCIGRRRAAARARRPVPCRLRSRFRHKARAAPQVLMRERRSARRGALRAAARPSSTRGGCLRRDQVASPCLLNR